MAKFYKISTQDGNKIDLTLNLGALAELSKSRKDLADRYFELYKKMQGKNGGLNEVEMGEVLYIACAHVGEDIPDLITFLHNLTDNREEFGQVFQQLFGVQEKKQNLQQHSRKQRRG
jgi:hypothetical protein